jgi:dTDP-4-dehydrorhamnose reductase
MTVVLITGATGLLGPYLAEAGARVGSVVTSGRRGGASSADLTQPHDVRRLLDATSPDIVVHAAALTDVDQCESHPSDADKVNHASVANLCAALPSETILVVLSTDQVYPDKPGPHREGDEGPVNVYGRTKLAGEKEAVARERSLVLRTNLFGPSRTPRRESLSDFVVQRLRSGEGADMFTDVLFSPLHMATLANLVFDSVAAGLFGVFNLGCREGTSKYDFGVAIARHLGLEASLLRTSRSDDISERTTRPHDLRLDVRSLEAALDRVMPTLAEEVQRL